MGRATSEGDGAARRGAMSERPISYAVIRGRVIDTDLIEFGGRGGDITFLAPDPHVLIGQLPLGSATRMQDLYELSFEQILDYLEELGQRLDINSNVHMRAARELSYATAPTTKPILDAYY